MGPRMGVNGCVYGCPSWRSVGQPDFPNARFVQVGTYNGAVFISGSDDGRGFGSVFHYHIQGLGQSPGPFLLAFPRGGVPMCCGWPSAETPEIGLFLGQSRLCSPFGLRVGADEALAKSTTYARRFIVNQGHQYN